MKIYEVLWDEDEYGYTVAMDPPLVFTTRELAEQAARKAQPQMHGYIVREVDLLDALPDDIATRDVGTDYGLDVVANVHDCVVKETT